MMAAVRRTTPVSKAPAAFFLLTGILSLAALASCGVADGRIEADAEAAPQDGAGPALLGLKPGRAVLVEGSEAVRGLPGFGRNALAALHGKYAFLQVKAATPLEIELWFTREILLMPAAWGKGPCRTTPLGFTMLVAPPEADGSALWSLTGAEYTLLVRMPAGMAEPCAFITVLADRFAFFYRYAARREDISFPAILQIDE